MKHHRWHFALAVLVATAVAVPAAPAGGRLSPAERRGINRTLDAFVPAAVRRDDPLAAVAWTAPSLRAGITRSQWRRGEIPVYPYPAAGKSFHYWLFSYRDRSEIGVELQLHSTRPRKIGPITFKVALEPHRGRWLVNSFMPAATFAPVGAPPKVRSQADFAAGSNTDPTVDRPRLGRIWFLVPLSVLGLSVLLAVGIPLVKWQRERMELRKT